jgi:hypothetical protein
MRSLRGAAQMHLGGGTPFWAAAPPLSRFSRPVTVHSRADARPKISAAGFLFLRYSANITSLTMPKFFSSQSFVLVAKMATCSMHSAQRGQAHALLQGLSD